MRLIRRIEAPAGPPPAPAPLADELLTTPDAGTRLGVNAQRVRQLIAEGRLPARKLGRQWLVRSGDLVLVADRRPGNRTGRPRTGKARADRGA